MKNKKKTTKEQLTDILMDEHGRCRDLVWGPDVTSDNLKLNLGCGRKPLYGYLNVDNWDGAICDIHDDIATLRSFNGAEGKIVEIRAVHCLEHLNFRDAEQALRRWYELLGKNRVLRVAVPDIEMACRLFIFNKNLPDIQTMFWGSQEEDNKGMYHLSGYTQETLTQLLGRIGFSAIGRYNPWNVYPNYVDDYSKSIYPRCNVKYRGGKAVDIDGVNLSLNLEAWKFS